ncbi:hypothetical protein [Sphingobacterium anhuiense]|uniref:hypothetical protein n=1 Tax=Sphingobacterium anhuiense TaxID=493780 RepID=UPI003C308B42
MKRFIAIALVGVFSLLMVGTMFASFDTKVAVELKKGIDNCGLHIIVDGVTPPVEPLYGKMVTVLSQDVTLSGYHSDITPNANGPPTIRML